MSKISLLAFCVLSIATLRPISAQEPAADGGKYKTNDVPGRLDVPLSEIRKVLSDPSMNGFQSNLDAVLKGDQPLSSHGKFLDNYYRRYYFARLTHEKNFAEWPIERQNFRQMFVRSFSMPADVRAYLVKLAHDELKKMVEENYHPVVRVNAVLMMGNLNTSELAGFPPQPPVPFAPALTTMLDAVKDETQLGGVKVAAMVGIERHAEMWGPKMPGEQRNELMGAMLTLLRSNDPAGQDAEGFQWMRKRAADVFGALGFADSKGNMVKALATVAKEDSSPTYVRCSAARALGRLQYGGINLPPAVGKNAGDALAALSFSIAKGELETLNAYQEAKEAEQAALTEGQLGSVRPPAASTVATPKDERQLMRSRRRAKYEMLAIKSAISGPADQRNPGGLMTAVTNNAALKSSLQKIEAAADTVITATDQEGVTLADLTAVIQTSLGQFQTMIRSAAPAAAAAPAAGQPAKNPLAPPADDTIAPPTEDGLPTLE